MDYDLIFSKRAAQYNFATKTYPHVLVNELRTAAEMVDAKKGDVVVNVPGACVDISPYLAHDVTYKPYEANAVFAKVASVPHSKFGSIPEADVSVDVVLSLASLHHSTDLERAVFYKEALRVLKPGGKMIIGDVISGSSQDLWLNTFVHQYNGHNGVFWSPADALTMDGFTVTIDVKHYRWTFNGLDEMVDFCRNLFGLDGASDKAIVDGLEKYLEADESGFDWSLIYFTAIKN
jgi:SAM-dependent methyltransferase